MAQVGANPDEMRRTAGLLASAAQRLDETSRQLTALLMASPWQGPAAGGFRADWNRHHRSGLAAAQEFLRRGHDTLLANADQQEQTSAPDAPVRPGGIWSATQTDGRSALTFPAGLFALFGAMGRTWQDGTIARLLAVGDTAGLLAFISSNASVTGRYTDAWRQVIRGAQVWGVPSSWLRFKSSPVLQGLHRVLHPGEGLLRRTSKVFDAVGPAGLALSLFGHADRVGDAMGRGDRVSAGVWLAEGTADLLKASKNPVSYLGGAAVQSWTEVAKAVRENTDAGNFTRQEWNRVVGSGWRVWGGAVADTLTKSLPGMLGRIVL